MRSVVRVTGIVVTIAMTVVVVITVSVVAAFAVPMIRAADIPLVTVIDIVVYDIAVVVSVICLCYHVPVIDNVYAAYYPSLDIAATATATATVILCSILGHSLWLGESEG